MSIYLDDKLLNEVSLERTINVSDGRYEIDYVRVYQNVSQNE